jgi:TetR/AcrR family transcriptional repressor of nem operon
MQRKNAKLPTAGADGTAVRILDVAQDLLQRRGYNGISYQDIAHRVGIRKASIHHHYAAKAELATAVVRRYREVWNRFLDKIDESDGDPWQKLDAYLEPFRATAVTGDRACLCGVLGAEFASLANPVRKEVRQFFAENEAWLADLLSAGRAVGCFEFPGNPECEAGVLFACLEGSLLVVRACGAAERFENVIGQLKAQLGAK